MSGMHPHYDYGYDMMRSNNYHNNEFEGNNFTGNFLIIKFYY